MTDYNKSDQFYEKQDGVVICGCMGAVYGEPYCPCTMRGMGLPMSKEHVEANKQFEKDVRAFFSDLRRQINE